MFGAVIGDIVGIRFKYKPLYERKVTLFHKSSHYSDKTLALSASSVSIVHIMDNIKNHKNMQTNHPQEYFLEKPQTVYDNHFLSKVFSDDLKHYLKNNNYGAEYIRWLEKHIINNHTPNNLFLARLSPIAFMCESLEEAKTLCLKNTYVTHQHADIEPIIDFYLTIFWTIRLWTGSIIELKENIKHIIKDFHINTVKEYRDMEKSETNAYECLFRVISALIEANSFIETIENVLYMGSDTDVTASIAGALAEMMYGIHMEDLEAMQNYFTYKDIDIIQQVAKIYPQSIKMPWGATAYNHIFSEKKMQWVQALIALKLEDPTAAWDPLEIPDDDNYYSHTHNSLKYQRANIFIKIWLKITKQNK